MQIVRSLIAPFSGALGKSYFPFKVLATKSGQCVTSFKAIGHIQERTS